MTRAGGPDRQDDALVLSTPIIASVFGLIFVAELPDKSAIASLVQSTNTAPAGCSPESPRPSPCTRCTPSPPGPLAQPSGSITSWCPVLTLRSAPIGQIRVRGPCKVGPGQDEQSDHGESGNALSQAHCVFFEYQIGSYMLGNGPKAPTSTYR